MTTRTRPLRSLVAALALGVLAGALLSLARAPLGVEATSVPAVSGERAALYRGLALIAVGLCLARARALSSPARTGALLPARTGALLFGALLGFALHGLWLVRWVELGGGGSLLAALAVLAAGMLAVGGGALRSRDEGQDGAGPAGARPGALECLGLGISGAGVAIALEGIARPLRLLGTGTTHDDTLFALMLLATLAVGAVAFGPALGGRRAVPALGLALAAVACLYAAQLLAELSTRQGLDRFLRAAPWRLDLAWTGRLSGGALIGARVFLLPGFVLGTALFAARHRLQLASALVGAGLGLVCLNALLIDGGPDSVRALSFHCAARVALGSLCAGAGGLVALAGARARLGRVELAAGALTGAAAMAGAGLGPRPQALPLSPWETFAPQVLWSADTPEGLLTVETSRGGEPVVTLDRRLLTPPGAEGLADENRLEMAWRALPADRRNGVRVLLIGQLTPLRAWVLRRLGAASVDRTAAWHASMPALEEQLFGGPAAAAASGGFEGRVLATAEAERRLAAGDYDLAIVPPTGPRGAHVPPAAASGTPLVVWLYADGDLAHCRLGERALLSSDGLDFLALGVLRGRGTEHMGVPTGRPRVVRTPLEVLRMWPFDRSRAFLLDLGQRLAEAGAGTPEEDLVAGLSKHLAAQRRSTPWESRAKGTETDDEALGRLARAMLSAEPDSPEALFLRKLWDGTARTLVEKREIGKIQTHLTPLAERLGPWPELERALAHAELELLEPARAAEHLRVVVESQPLDLNAHMKLGHALEMAGDPAGAATEFRRALEIQPGRRDVRRRLAMALVRAGDPDGGPLLEELLAEDPGDEELERFRGPGPFPAPEVRFVPFARQEHADHEHEDEGVDETGHGPGDHR